MAKITYNTSPYTGDADLPHSPAVTHPCPGCEAAARELADLKSDKAWLQKLSTENADELSNLRREHDALRAGILRVIEDYPRAIKQDAEEALRALVAGTVAPVSGDSDLRARLAALADEWMENGVLARLEGDTDAANGVEWHALKLRALLAETEGK